MKKLLIATGALLGLLALTPIASAQDYTYNCLCLFADPSGTCAEYTCDAHERPSYSRYYDYGNDCGRYSNCGYRPYYAEPSVYRTIGSSTYSNYYNDNYYNNGYDYSNDWYSRRYGSTRLRRYSNPYYDAPMYYY